MKTAPVLDAPVLDAPVLGAPRPHDSAAWHVDGQALYLDDIAEPAGLLHAVIGLSRVAHARFPAPDLSEVAASPGVAAVLMARDVPGVNDVGPSFPGDPIFADGLVEYHGQSVFVVAAETLEQARAAAALARIDYEVLKPVLTIDEALAAQSFVLPTQVMRRGDADAALARAPRRLKGRLLIGGQDHFYLEGQIAMAIPGEGDDMHLFSSTQHPTEVQHLTARALGIADHNVVCESRRLGGGFGGKESQASQIAVIAALLAARTRRPVKLRLDRDDDMVLTGKRHDFRTDWDVGFDDTGRIEGITFELASRCGISPDLSGAINDRAMFHSDNAYFLGNATIVSHRCKTNMVSATAFRGFGGPQGMMGIEAVMDAIARHLRLDPLDVRKRNFYGGAGRDETHYGMRVENFPVPAIIRQLEASSEYAARRRAIDTFNATSRWSKRGLALTPVKFGIAFTLLRMNQAGALVHVYTDGSVMLNHGGIEMGQGLFVKVAQIVADAFGVPLDRIKNTATSTAKVPNTSPTAASSGTDLNGHAAHNAACIIRARLAAVVAAEFGVDEASIAFRAGQVVAGDRALPFVDAVRLAYSQRVQLSAAGFYRTPKIHYDYATHRGRPFLYFACGAAVAEVEIDTLTGEYRLHRADIVHDCGRSLNPAVDRGQIEGGFVQGMGWLTTEELVWDTDGVLRTHAPSTYKIPSCGDVPTALHIDFFDDVEDADGAVHKSKAVGEPPLMLGIAVFQALQDAVCAACPGDAPRLDAPATPERVLMAIAAHRARQPA